MIYRSQLDGESSQSPSPFLALLALCIISFLFGVLWTEAKYADKLKNIESKVRSHKCIYTDTNYIWITVDSVEHDCYGINPNYHKGKRK